MADGVKDPPWKGRSSYFLTQVKPNISCLGTSFPSVAVARDHALNLRAEWGLCEVFSIGCYIDGVYTEVYRSEPWVDPWSKTDDGEARGHSERPGRASEGNWYL